MNDERHIPRWPFRGALSSSRSFPVTQLDFLYFSHEDFAIGVVGHIPILLVFAIGHDCDGFTGWAIQFWLVVCGRKPFALYVGLHPKVGEEKEEEDTVYPDQVDPHGDLEVTFLHEVVLADVNGDQDELRLQNRERICGY